MTVRRGIAAVLIRLATLLLISVTLLQPALGQTSPAGYIDDRASTFSDSELRTLDLVLENRQFRYRVFVLDGVFPDLAPAQKQEPFQRLAASYLSELKIGKDEVLITIVMKDRLVDFRVWVDGTVNQTVLKATGREFGAHSGDMLASFREPAGRGDFIKAIGAAVGTIERLVPSKESASPGEIRSTPAVVTPATPPTSAGTEATDRSAPAGESSHAASSLSESQPESTSIATTLLWLLGIILVAVVLLVAVQALLFAWRRWRALKLRDGAAEAVLPVIEREMPQLRSYEGEETRQLVEIAAAAVEQATFARETGDQQLRRAEQQARRLRFGPARQSVSLAHQTYERAAAALRDAHNAFTAVAQALQSWDEALSQGQEGEHTARVELNQGKEAWGWPLDRLEQRHQAAVTALKQARTAREGDPVRATRMAKEADGAFHAILTDLQSLSSLQEAYQQQQEFRARGHAKVADARQSLGLRFVEANPDGPLARALEHEQEMTRCMSAGDVPGAQQALQAAGEAVQQAIDIVMAYRTALAEYPGKLEQLRRALQEIVGQRPTAAQVLTQLQATYIREEWDEVAGIPRALQAFETQVREVLTEVAGLVTPAEQRYLKAVEMLDHWLGERQRIQQGFEALTWRLRNLNELVGQAQASLGTASSHVQSAGQTARHFDLRLPAELHQQANEVDERMAVAQRIGSSRPLSASMFAQAAADAAQWAVAWRQGVEEVARLAQEARNKVDRADSTARRALQYESYDRSEASQLRRALDQGREALNEGRYGDAIEYTEAALRNCRDLEAAYRRYQEEQERQRREQEEAQRRQRERDQESSISSFSSSSSSTSNSDNSDRTSGGGGSW